MVSKSAQQWRHAYRWDLDKTYLDTHFESLSELVRIPFQDAEDKVNVPGSAALLRELTRVFIKPATDWRICHTDTFDWWHPYYNHYHTLEELRTMVQRAELKLVAADVPYYSVRAAVAS